MRKIQRANKVDKTVKQVIKKAKEPVSIKRKNVDPNMLIPTPSTTFNLECSGRIEGAFQIGKTANLIGDSHSGKTLFALSMLAECSHNSRFDGFDLIYHDVEEANEFDIPYMFGKKTDSRLIYDVRGSLFEEFSDNIGRLLSGNRPFIYVLDSFDALDTEASRKKDEENRKKREKGSKTDGEYGDGKAKLMSAFFRHYNDDLKAHGSSLIIVSQTRDNIGFGAMFAPKTRSGGKALKFYACHEVWLATQKKEKIGKRTYITNVQAKITKNKLTGRHGEALFPILFDYGIDNIASCIKFLMDEGGWTGSKRAINSKEFVDTMSYDELVKHIEENDLEENLALCCQEAYNNVFAKLTPQRKRKY